MKRLLTAGLLTFATIGTVAGVSLNDGASAERWSETFDGTPNNPLDWSSDEFDITYHVRDGWYMENITPNVRGQHGASCSAPPDSHSITTIPGTVFQCNDHVMTTQPGSGYGVTLLTPNRLVDFSNGPAVIQWEMSTEDTNQRDWPSLTLQPWDTNQSLNALSGLIQGTDLQGRPRNAFDISFDTNTGSRDSVASVYITQDGSLVDEFCCGHGCARPDWHGICNPPLAHGCCYRGTDTGWHRCSLAAVPHGECDRCYAPERHGCGDPPVVDRCRLGDTNPDGNGCGFSPIVDGERHRDDDERGYRYSRPLSAVSDGFSNRRDASVRYRCGHVAKPDRIGDRDDGDGGGHRHRRALPAFYDRERDGDANSDRHRRTIAPEPDCRRQRDTDAVGIRRRDTAEPHGSRDRGAGLHGDSIPKSAQPDGSGQRLHAPHGDGSRHAPESHCCCYGEPAICTSHRPGRDLGANHQQVRDVGSDAQQVCRVGQHDQRNSGLGVAICLPRSTS